MRRVLLIARYFPPLGGPGVQRSLKLVKYLSLYGVEPIILTGPESDGSHWASPDPTMLAEVPNDVAVHRVPAGNDASFGAWLKTGEAVARRERVEAILVSMSPFEHALVAGALSASTKRPWVADLRDPWALDECQVHRTWLHRRWAVQRMVEHLKSAAIVVANTPEAARRLRTVMQGAMPVVALPNGYDEEDFDRRPLEPSPIFTIVHSGSLHSAAGLRQRRLEWQYRAFGRVRDGMTMLPRSHFYLLRALERWLTLDPFIVDRVRLVFVGRLSVDDISLIEASSVAAMCQVEGYQAHREAVKRISSADTLFLPMHSLREGCSATIVPGKTYEYMASGRPIVAAVPNGDARRYLEQCGTATLCEPSDIEGISEALRSLYERWRTKAHGPVSNGTFVSEFERRRVARAMAGVVESAISGGAPDAECSPLW